MRLARFHVVLAAVALAASPVASDDAAPPVVPVYRVRATSLYDAGYQIGALARQQIKAWINLGEFRRTELFVSEGGAGADAFAALKRDNMLAYPE